MIRSICFLSIILSFLIFNNPVYSKEVNQKSIENYINKISNKFSRTYCNTTQFGISNEGALAFSIGETNKEFKNNKLNNLINYDSLKNQIVNKLENNCAVYDFQIERLENLQLN